MRIVSLRGRTLVGILFAMAGAGLPVHAANGNCSLLTAEEANTAFGLKLQKGAPGKSNDGKPDCEYKAADQSEMVVGLIEKGGKAILDSEKSMLSDNPGKVEEVPDLADQALVQVFSEGGGTIVVLRGDVLFVIAIGSKHPIPVKDGLIQLARKALTRI